MAMSGTTHESFSNNKMRDKQLPLLMQWLEANPHITELDLSGNQISAAGAAYFAKHNKTVTNLNLSNNPICDQGAREFATHNRVTTKLNLIGSGVSDIGIKYFFTAKIKTSVNIKSARLSRAILNQLQEHNAAAEKLYDTKPFWMSTSVVIAFLKANQGNTLENSVLPLTSTILEFAGCAENPQQQASMQGFMKTSYFLRQSHSEEKEIEKVAAPPPSPRGQSY